MFRCGGAQAGGQAAGDLLLGQQGVRPGEGNGQNEGGVEEHQVGPCTIEEGFIQRRRQMPSLLLGG